MRNNTYGWAIVWVMGVTLLILVMIWTSAGSDVQRVGLSALVIGLVVAGLVYCSRDR